MAIPGATCRRSRPRLCQPDAGDDSQAIGQQLSNLLDKTTIVNVPVMRGGVSVNHASRAVLRSVPGIDDALAERILGARGSQTSQDDAAAAFRPGC